jgi:hypothetical protein
MIPAHAYGMLLLLFIPHAQLFWLLVPGAQFGAIPFCMPATPHHAHFPSRAELIWLIQRLLVEKLRHITPR